MSKTNNLKKEIAHRLGPRMIYFDIFFLDLYKYSSSWLHSGFFSGSFHHPPVREFFPSIFPSLLYLNSPRVDQIANLLDICPIRIFLKFLWVVVRLKITVQISLPH